MTYRPGSFIQDSNFGTGLILELLQDSKFYRMQVYFTDHGKKYIKVNKIVLSKKGSDEKLLR